MPPTPHHPPVVAGPDNKALRAGDAEPLTVDLGRSPVALAGAVVLCRTEADSTCQVSARGKLLPCPIRPPSPRLRRSVVGFLGLSGGGPPPLRKGLAGPQFISSRRKPMQNPRKPGIVRNRGIYPASLIRSKPQLFVPPGFSWRQLAVE